MSKIAVLLGLSVWLSGVQAQAQMYNATPNGVDKDHPAPYSMQQQQQSPMYGGTPNGVDANHPAPYSMQPQYQAPMYGGTPNGVDANHPAPYSMQPHYQAPMYGGTPNGVDANHPAPYSMQPHVQSPMYGATPNGVDANHPAPYSMQPHVQSPMYNATPNGVDKDHPAPYGMQQHAPMQGVPAGFDPMRPGVSAKAPAPTTPWVPYSAMKRAEPAAQGAPPSGTYTCHKISVNTDMLLGKLVIRGNSYAGIESANFAPFTVAGNGDINWTAGIQGMPPGWRPASGKFIGNDQRGRPVININYITPHGAAECIECIRE